MRKKSFPHYLLLVTHYSLDQWTNPSSSSATSPSPSTPNAARSAPSATSPCPSSPARPLPSSANPAAENPSPPSPSSASSPNPPEEFSTAKSSSRIATFSPSKSATCGKFAAKKSP